MAGRKQAPAKREEEDVAGEPESEGWDDAAVETDKEAPQLPLRMRDWRDVERYREMKELKDLVDDDSGIAEIFAPPPRPEPKLTGKAAKAAAAAKLAAAKLAAAQAQAQAQARTKAAPPPAPAKPVAGKHKPAPAHPAKAHGHGHAQGHGHAHAKPHHRPVKAHAPKVKAKRHR